jgi:hypothetical protein
MSSLVPGPTDTGRCPVVQRLWFRHAHERSSECVVSAGQAGNRRVDATTGRPSRLRGRPFRVCPSGDGYRPARAASPPGPCAGRRPPGRCAARSGSVDQSRLRRSEAGRGGRRCRGREHRSASRTRGRVRSGRISVRLRLRFGRSGVRFAACAGAPGDGGVSTMSQDGGSWRDPSVVGWCSNAERWTSESAPVSGVLGIPSSQVSLTIPGSPVVYAVASARGVRVPAWAVDMWSFRAARTAT